ncbi:MAG: DUF1343 domain-containing protein [Nitrospiraceae bacterium]|nr:DUF1343 domain-containing protein [Nitrospiraceae bacterium]
MRSFLSAILCIVCGLAVPFSAHAEPAAQPLQSLHAERLAAIADIVETSVRDRKTPGAVVLVGNRDEVVYRRAFGFRSLEPEKAPMTEDTVFDLASLTKVVATTTAIMQLAEKGKLDIEYPVDRYWRAFGKNGKGKITVRQLLTHYSGLRPDLSLRPQWSGYRNAMRKIVAEKPVIPPGTGYIYSDINFEVLGELVRRVSGLSLDKYCSTYIFGPLGMRDTVFLPPVSLQRRIAPTQYYLGKMLCGKAHDPSCFRMGGVAGHAGLFSTADDLSRFARMLLNKGSYQGKKILSPKSIQEMTMPQSPPGGKKLRGFGWEIERPLGSDGEGSSSSGAYGHLGYTGTALWIDPATETYIILLTNRVHPDGKGDVKELRAGIKRVVADALRSVSAGQVPAKGHSPAAFYASAKKGPLRDPAGEKVMTGIDVLSAGDFLPLKGLRVGLVTNNTGLDSGGRSTLDLLFNAPGVHLKAIFSPEHGLSGTYDREIKSGTDPGTGLPVYSLYGKVRRPTGEMLTGLDALVFDIQDAGVRFYTYITTLGYAMEAAASNRIAFYVLDRPDLLNATSVQGPVMDKGLRSFTGYFPLPVRYGMTVGELAEMFNSENRIGADLHVVRMSGYARSDWFDETGLRWTNPSPNLRSLTEATLYPGVAMVEGANVSVGRGTGTPFELLGAPWIDGQKLARYLRDRKIAGVFFSPAVFTPNSDRYKHKECHGVRMTMTNRETLDIARMGIEIAAALHKLYPKKFRLDDTLGVIGSRRTLQYLRDDMSPRSIALHWKKDIDHFLALRSKYLLY